MKPFLPPWLEGPPPPGSWRALFRWGDPDQARHPGPRLVRMLQEAFELSDEEFRKPRRTGLEPRRPAHHILFRPQRNRGGRGNGNDHKG